MVPLSILWFAEKKHLVLQAAEHVEVASSRGVQHDRFGPFRTRAGRRIQFLHYHISRRLDFKFRSFPKFSTSLDKFSIRRPSVHEWKVYDGLPSFVVLVLCARGCDSKSIGHSTLSSPPAKLNPSTLHLRFGSKTCLTAIKQWLLPKDIPG